MLATLYTLNAVLTASELEIWLLTPCCATILYRNTDALYNNRVR
jgi:hypothetical protein